MKVHFYCQHLVGEVDFDIDEWNTVYHSLLSSGMSEAKMNEILNPPACKEQCFTCMAIVGERQAKTKDALKK